MARRPPGNERAIARRVAAVRDRLVGYYRLAEDRCPIFRLEGWIRRHIRKCFWPRRHSVRGRCRKWRRLGVPEEMPRFVPTRRGAWFVARQRMMHTALSNRTLSRYGFVMPSDLAAGR